MPALLSSRLARLLVAATAAGALALGCGDSGHGNKPASKPDSAFGAYAIHVFEQAKDASGKSGYHEVQFGPADAALLKADKPAQHAANVPAGEIGPGMHTQTTVQVDGGNVDPDLAGYASGMGLLLRAAQECGYAAPASELWREDNWFFFRDTDGSLTSDGLLQTSSCDDILLKEQQLLCVADKLANVADAVQPLVWETAAGKPRWIIPPQRNADRFIARDLAITTLANLARMDQEVPSWGLSEYDCSEAYAKSADPNQPGYAITYSSALYDASPNRHPEKLDRWGAPSNSVFDSTWVVQDHVYDFAESRLDIEAKTLNAAGELLKKLIDDSVEADMSGAYVQKAKAGDPKLGVARFFMGDGQTPYNSIGHLLRVLYGRWELDALPHQDTPGPIQPWLPWRDPECQGYHADAVAGAMVPGVMGKLDALPTRSMSQLAAVKMLEPTGIVIDVTHIQGLSIDPTTTRNAVKEQLELSGAQQAGLDLATFTASARGQAVAQQFDAVGNADFTFAMEHNFRAFQAITGVDQGETLDQDVLTNKNGVNYADAATVSGTMKLNGIVLAHGIPKIDATGDQTALAGPAWAASECPYAEPRYWYQPFTGVSLRSAFQDVFTMGGTFERRLAAIHDFIVAHAHGNGMDQSAAEAHSRVGAAEIRAWAGPGMAAATRYTDGNNDAFFHVWLTGLTAKDLGVLDDGTSDPITPMQGQIVLVKGQQWQADCAAGLRKSCEGYETSVVQPITDEPYRNDPSGWPGIDGHHHDLEFPDPGTDTTPGSALYLVSKSSPDNVGHGRVLAVFPNASPWSNAPLTVQYISAVSDYRTKLTNSALGIDPSYGQAPGLGGASPSEPEGYCLLGKAKRIFVPLENELTSDADPFENSWKHYLTLAQQSAQRADDLGNELIAQGLQKDFRSEAAGEELANLCGDYTALDNVEVKAGDVQPSTDDEALNQCLGEDKVDVVFLTTDPWPPGENHDAEIRVKLGCHDPIDVKDSPLCAKTDISHAGLGLAKYEDPDATAPPTCDLEKELVASTSGVFNSQDLQQLAENPHLDTMASILSGLRIKREEDLSWKAELHGQVIMDTQATGLWPHCANGNSCGSNDLAASLDAALNSGPYRINANVGEPSVNEILFERLTGVVWLMGALAGHMPDNVFDLWIPAVDFSAATPATSAVSAVIYGQGRYLADQNNNYALEPTGNGTFDEDIQDLGTGRKIGLLAANGLRIAPHPAWLHDLYADAFQNSSEDHYLEFETKTRGHTFPPLGVDKAQFGGSKSGAVGAWLNARAAELAGSTGGSGCDGKYADTAKAVLFAKFPGAPSSVSQICTAEDGKTPLMFYSAGGAGSTQTVGDWCGDNGLKGPFFCPSFSHWTIPHDLDAGIEAAFWYTGGIGAKGKAVIPLNTDGQHTGVPYMPANWLDTDADGYRQAKLGPANLQFGASASDHTVYPARVLLPQVCPKENRAHLFLNSLTPFKRWDSSGNSYGTNGCLAGEEIARALALSCVLSQYRVLGRFDDLPAMAAPSDIPALEDWIDDQAKHAHSMLSRILLTSVPKRVVEDFAAGTPGTGILKGEHGKLILAYEQGADGLSSGWSSIEGDLMSIEGAIENARVGLVAADLDEKTTLAQYAMQRIQLEAQEAQDAVGIMGGIASLVTFNPFPLASSVIGLQATEDQQDIMNDLSGIPAEKNANDIVNVLNQLRTAVGPQFTSMQGSFDQLRGSVAAVKSNGVSLEQQENQAAYQVAKAKLADYVTTPDGQTVPMPVNTALRRQFDLTNRRYRAALEDAKYMAYLARLAIEQRIGVHLDEIDHKVGVLAAPKEWADDLCEFTGIDYSKFRAGDVPGADGGLTDNQFFGLKDDDETKFTDPYIGDYVQKLQDFVEYYNVDYPSHEGDDVAVLSLRDDLIGPQGQCSVTARNLLLFSDALDQRQGDAAAPAGWILDACDSVASPPDANCLVVSGNHTLVDDTGSPLQPPEIAVQGGVSWLHEVPVTDLYMDMGDAGTAAPVVPAPPRGSAYQPVQLDGGKSYVLSWWDLARDANGNPVDRADGGAPTEYRVAIYDANWNLVHGDTPIPYDPTSPDAGGASLYEFAIDQRKQFTFTAPDTGTYYVLFGASVGGLPEGGDPGSVAIADVQLEDASTSGGATGYQHTTVNRLVLSHDCASKDPTEFRNAFKYVCDGTECYHELISPIAIDTTAIRDGKSRLNGKIARGNYNYRTLSWALNVVGTGVVDCSVVGSQSCYGSAYLEYSVDHAAFDIPILDYYFDVHTFSFGLAHMNHAKALAAERYITLPIGSADAALLAQPEATKVEFRGRPLDGTYALRIYDKPGFIWNNVEDVQVVLDYRYWSRIDPESTSN